jgi:CheY-like chemotaxis protein
MRIDHRVTDFEPPAQSELAPLRLLVIEDVPEMLYVFRFYLQGTPYSADLVSTG